ncbi:MAG: hypothetical protein AUK55_14035 [Syntrophobacteraceae bacterium CG2_30_61_12]|nr:MAG: hypothetical protein AUK55_14035 [Syntrophobacteraceae bacterium CG2_30_61_12]PIU32453.1 MAG: hypothetical protein COT06_02630 [Syntrophobacteraceae bacterium CG07_land_8_20_14_0_80_61_8]
MESKRHSTVDILRSLPGVFTSVDVGKLVNDANMFLYRASRKGYIQKIAKGIYANELFGRKPSVEEIACFVRRPAYVSCEWALNHHGVILQVPVVCTCITLTGSVGERRKIAHAGISIEYSRIAQHLFWGFDSADGVNMATAEKALADYVYLRKALPFPDEIELDHIDVAKLNEIMKPYPKTTRKLVHGFIAGFVKERG